MGAGLERPRQRAAALNAKGGRQLTRRPLATAVVTGGAAARRAECGPAVRRATLVQPSFLFDTTSLVP